MNPFLNTAFKAARKAGQMMIRAAGNLDAVKVDSKAFNDFVSDVDRSSEMILVEALKEAYPHHKITCEEGGSHGKATAEYEWIIDPARRHDQLPPRPSPIRHLYGTPAQRRVARSFGVRT